MADPKMHRYAPRGLLALEPQAFGLEFLTGAGVAAPPLADGKIAVVRVCGPISFAGFLFDTYDAIRCRVRDALASPAECVILVLDSPGGDVAGCFDCARGIRADAAEAKKSLIAWVPAKACSAAYALAAACTRIEISDTAYVGSIGVIHEMQSVARQDATAGVDFAFVTSGTKKAYGNPHTPITEGALAETQTLVDTTAERFFSIVEEWRRFDPRPLEAGVLIGSAAVARGLADSVTTFDAMVSSLTATIQSGGAIQPMSATRATNSEDPSMPKDEEKKDADATRAALVTATKSDDAVKAKRATKALKAYDDEEEAKAELPEKEGKASKAEADDKDGDGDKDKAKAEVPPKKDDDKALAAASELGKALAASNAEIAALKARVAASEAADAAKARADYFASRPDLPESVAKSLEGLSLAQCKSIVDAIPVSAAFKSQYPELARKPLAGGPPTTIEAKASSVIASDPALAAAMGLTASKTVVEMAPEMGGVVQSFGVKKVVTQ